MWLIAQKNNRGFAAACRLRRCAVPVVGIVMSLPVALASGCSLAGTWSTVSVTPPNARFDLSYVTFDKRGHYTATARCDGESHTSVGRYRWNGSKLVVVPDGGAERTYRGRLGLSGELTLVHETAVVRIEATLEKNAE